MLQWFLSSLLGHHLQPGKIPSGSSKVPLQDLAGTNPVPLVSGDTGGKKDSIPAVQGRDRCGVRMKPFSTWLQSAAVAQESSLAVVAVALGGTVALERSQQLPMAGHVWAVLLVLKEVTSWCDKPHRGPGGLQEAPKVTREKFCPATVLPCCPGATAALFAAPPPTPCTCGFLGFVMGAVKTTRHAEAMVSVEKMPCICF